MHDDFLQARRVLDAFLADAALLADADDAANLLADTLHRGCKVMICGNGGSACDAAHFAEELSGRYKGDRKPLAALACTDVGHVTCVANDYGFEFVFSRWVEALAQPGDTLIVLSTSGQSPNIVRALDAAKAKGVQTIALLGKSGGPCKALADHALVFPGQTSDRIQELHMMVLHTFVAHIERALGLA
ncbi:MAG: SIS domain-containing protein [Phycisphaerales bacterium]|nr:SIS domain-containing protein [Phycisphaerales bacterium]